MATATISSPAEMTIKVSDLSLVSDIKRLLRHINGIESIVVTKKKSELDRSLDDVKSGKIVTVGSVDNLMQYLHD